MIFIKYYIIFNKIKNKDDPYFYTTGSRNIFIKSMDGSAGSATPHTASLEFGRLVVLGETNVGDFLNEQIIKKITGGDAICHRNLYSKKEKSFYSRSKLLIITNHLPRFEASASMSDRAEVIPFDNRFSNNDRYKQKMLSPSMINAFFDIFINTKINIDDRPDAVIEATNNYINENDYIGGFIQRNFNYGKEIICQENGKIQAGISLDDVYNLYIYCFKDDNGSDVKPTLTKKGLRKAVVSSLMDGVGVYNENNRYFNKLYLKADYEEYIGLIKEEEEEE